MRYLHYENLATPNIVVDESATDRTLITLSHWPHSGTPPSLKADLSAQIVFKYLEHPELHVKSEAVSNNHFDEDGLAGIYALLHPCEAETNEDLLIDIAAAGDFGTYRFRDAARVDLTSLAEELSNDERGNASWQFDGVDALAPALHIKQEIETSLSSDEFIKRAVRHLSTSHSQWNPYD